MTTMTGGMTMPGETTGARLIAAVLAAAEQAEAVRAEWDTLPREPAGWIRKEIREAWFTRVRAAEDADAAARAACWGYFEGRRGYDGPERPAAEELAAWWFL